MNKNRIIYHTFFVLLSLIMAFPFFYLFKMSFQPDADVMIQPIRFFPTSLHPENYVHVVQKLKIWSLFSNSMIYSVLASILTVITAACAAYPLAKLRLPGAPVLVIFFVASMLLPPDMRAVPMYTMLAKWGWVNTWRGMILPYTTTGFAIFFIYQYMITIPDELLEACRLDGASELQILGRLIAPMSKTAVGTMLLYNFLFRWRDYIWPLIMTKGKVTTLSVGLPTLLSGEALIQWNLIACAAMFLFFPSLLLFLFLRRYIMTAISMNLK